MTDIIAVELFPLNSTRENHSQQRKYCNGFERIITRILLRETHVKLTETSTFYIKFKFALGCINII